MNNLNYKIGGDKRDTQIDILKGIGIFLMVFRHARGPYSDFVLLFHMALFFIASGYLYKRDNEYTKNNFVKFIKRKLKSLWCAKIVTPAPSARDLSTTLPTV